MKKMSNYIGKCSPVRQIVFYQLVVINLIFYTTNVLSSKDRVSVYCLLDASFVNQCFGGDEEAAINFTIMHFETINQDFCKENPVHIDEETGEKFYFKNFGFDLWAIDLGHEVFSQFEKQQVINVKQLKATLKSDALFKEHSNYGQVVYLTGKQLSDNHNGFKVGAVCQPPENAVAISFYGCQNKNDSTAYDRILRTTKEELIHSFGVPHSKDEDNDVMKEVNSTNMNMSNNTKKIFAFSIYDIKEGCLVERNDNVRLIYLNRTEKVVKCQEVIAHMNATVNIKISQNTTIFQSKINETIFEQIVNSLSKLVVFSTLSKITIGVTIIAVAVVGIILVWMIYTKCIWKKIIDKFKTERRLEPSNNVNSVEPINENFELLNLSINDNARNPENFDNYSTKNNMINDKTKTKLREEPPIDTHSDINETTIIPLRRPDNSIVNVLGRVDLSNVFFAEGSEIKAGNITMSFRKVNPTNNVIASDDGKDKIRGNHFFRDRLNLKDVTMNQPQKVNPKNKIIASVNEEDEIRPLLPNAN